MLAVAFITIYLAVGNDLATHPKSLCNIDRRNVLLRLQMLNRFGGCEDCIGYKNFF